MENATNISNTRKSHVVSFVGPVKMVTNKVLINVRGFNWIDRWGGGESIRSVQRIDWHVERRTPFMVTLQEMIL